MKMKKFLLCMATALFVANTVSINAFAAEVNTVEQTQNAETTVNDTTSQEVDQTTTSDSTNTEENTTEETETAETTETVEESKNEETDNVDKVKEVKETSTKTTTTKKVTTAKVSYTKAELRLLSALIYCEAGNESYAGKLAVGIIVVNRMESKAFPNTLKGVVYQKSQFGPVRNGSLNRALNEYDNNKFTSAREKQCIKAAKAALSGTKTITYKKNGKTTKKNLSGYYYFSGRLSNARFSLGGHQFK
ncbi:cell wall hydrolase [Anaerosporobacter faecicola]|uniref:cell wall hydrolase n=1 Tax=Anaerosporobacter faecicola TaxID=2718714 RepID=UPI0014390C0F|nr:cell wall hydrolase [Anaerosporobacter faecicola]